LIDQRTPKGLKMFC